MGVNYVTRKDKKKVKKTGVVSKLVSRLMQKAATDYRFPKLHDRGNPLVVIQYTHFLSRPS
jgi:hypothetical protein